MKQESNTIVSTNKHSSNNKSNDNTEKINDSINHSNHIIRKKTAVHDVSHVIIQDYNKVKNLISSIIIWFILFICKLMTEAHSLIAIYHSKIILFGNTSENRTAKNFDELRLSRKQTFSHIISTFEKLIPQFAQ